MMHATAALDAVALTISAIAIAIALVIAVREFGIR
jgi:hypothetical protein